jgi:hypothetical protein
MKKLLLMFVLTFSLISSKAQDTTSLTIKEVYTDIKAGFTQLVSTLEGPAKHTYSIYVKQFYMEGMANLLGFILTFILAMLIFIFSSKKALNDEPSKHLVFFIFGVICTVISVTAGIALFHGGLQKLLNPEYYAIDKIITSFIK